MIEVVAPDKREFPGTSVFLAGGITNCPDWQYEMVGHLRETSLILLNPRRADFDVRDPAAGLEQIRWEHRYLRAADMLIFWFCAATLCPITLYELGAWSMTDKPIAIGIEPGYKREIDVRVQTELVRPEVLIVDSLEDLAELCQEELAHLRRI